MRPNSFSSPKFIALNIEIFCDSVYCWPAPFRIVAEWKQRKYGIEFLNSTCVCVCEIPKTKTCSFYALWVCSTFTLSLDLLFSFLTDQVTHHFNYVALNRWVIVIRLEFIFIRYKLQLHTHRAEGINVYTSVTATATQDHSDILFLALSRCRSSRNS